MCSHLISADVDRLLGRNSHQYPLASERIAVRCVHRQFRIYRWNDQINALAAADVQNGLRQRRVETRGHLEAAVRQMKGRRGPGTIRHDKTALKAQILQGLAE